MLRPLLILSTKSPWNKIKFVIIGHLCACRVESVHISEAIKISTIVETDCNLFLLFE
jgi:hypothetical protein